MLFPKTLSLKMQFIKFFANPFIIAPVGTERSSPYYKVLEQNATLMGLPPVPFFLIKYCISLTP